MFLCYGDIPVLSPPIKFLANCRSLWNWKQSLHAKTHSMILLCESQEPIKLHHVGLQSGCLQDEVADTQSSAFTHFHWLGNPKEN